MAEKARSSDPICDQSREPGEAIHPELCVVCQQVLLVDVGACAEPLPCGHGSWHQECIQQWLDQQHSCPICRARLPGFEEGDSDEELDFEDAERLRERLRTRLADFEQTFENQVRLQLLRQRLAERMADLERERRRLESQVQRIGAELMAFGQHLARLSENGSTTTASKRDEGCQKENGSDVSVEVGEHSEDTLGAIAPDAHHSNTLEPSSACSMSPRLEDDERKAKDVLHRLRGAVLRTPLPAAEVFRGLAARTGRLGPEEAETILRTLEAAAPTRVVSRAFAILDVNNSGFVEEADWMAALQLPGMSPSAYATIASARDAHSTDPAAS